MHEFLGQLHADARFADLQAKESWSDRAAFRKLLVKVKREIIRMNHPAIQPAQGARPPLTRPTLKRWLDQGHDDAGTPGRHCWTPATPSRWITAPSKARSTGA